MVYATRFTVQSMHQCGSPATPFENCVIHTRRPHAVRFQMVLTSAWVVTGAQHRGPPAASITWNETHAVGERIPNAGSVAQSREAQHGPGHICSERDPHAEKPHAGLDKTGGSSLPHSWRSLLNALSLSLSSFLVLMAWVRFHHRLLI
jgi:hypothetical protein